MFTGKNSSVCLERLLNTTLSSEYSNPIYLMDMVLVAEIMTSRSTIVLANFWTCWKTLISRDLEAAHPPK